MVGMSCFEYRYTAKPAICITQARRKGALSRFLDHMDLFNTLESCLLDHMDLFNTLDGIMPLTKVRDLGVRSAQVLALHQDVLIRVRMCVNEHKENVAQRQCMRCSKATRMCVCVWEEVHVLLEEHRVGGCGQAGVV